MSFLIPYFQPIVDTWTNTNIGYEATIRGSKNESARTIFRRAYSKGETINIDQNARELAIHSGLSLLDDNQKLFINISPQTLAELPHQKWWGEKNKDMCLSKIVLEITESAPLKVSKLQKDLRTCKNEGLSIAIDDFGKGYSNYDILAKLGFVEYIKLDKMFIDHCNKSRYLNIIKHLVRLGQDISNHGEGTIKVIAEGIENEWQKEILQSVGIRYMQGYYFGYPQPLSFYNEKESLTQ